MKRSGTLSTVFVLLLAAPLLAQPAPEEPRTVAVPMPDGVELLTDVHLPGAAGPHPVVLVRTPYGREGYEGRAAAFIEAGYALVVQSVRGNGGSGGRFVPFVAEREDGAATLDWLLERPWAGGEVVLYGDSYLGYAALRIAETGHPAVKALFLGSPFYSIDGMLYPGGAFHLMLNVPWNMMSFGLFESVTSWDSVFARVPVTEMIRTPAGAVHPGWREAMGFFGGAYPETDPRLEALEVDLEAVRAPVFILTGWHDFVLEQAIAVHERVSARSDDPGARRLVVGPWYHDQADWGGTEVGGVDFGPEAELGMERKVAMAVDWFDRWTGPDRPSRPAASPVRLFLMGPNRWIEADRWPPTSIDDVAWHLAGGGEDGSALARSPAAAPAADTLLYDPNDPVPTVGGVNVSFFPDNLGPLDQRDVEARPDVLSYTSGPLERDAELIGRIRAELFVAADAPDTDVTAKLVVVRPDGRARIVQEGIRRLRFRRGRSEPSALEPGEIVRAEIDVGPTALHVPAGHRLRLEVSGGSFPKYDRNPNTGENPLTATRFRPVRITVHRGSATPSRVILPWRRGGGTPHGDRSDP